MPPLIKHMNIKQAFYLLSLALFVMACGGNTGTDAPKIKDLAFEHTTTAKEYADLIIKTIKTNRDKVVFQQFADNSEVNSSDLNVMIKTYTHAISEKRKAWEYVDYYEENGGEPAGDDGYDYTWYDERGRIAVQINVLPKGTSNGFKLDKIEFRSRIEILESQAFPGGEISDYKKLVSKK